MKSVLITGSSRGLGKAFVMRYLENDYQVLGIARGASGLEHPNYIEIPIDLSAISSDKSSLEGVLREVKTFDHVILNAGVLGKIKDMKDTTLDEINEIMSINTWANKVILDYFIEHHCHPAYLLAISSGASVNGNRGWNAYSLSKAALNMLIQLYSHELPHTQMISIAPGLVRTAMQDQLCESPDTNKFTSLAVINDLYQNNSMPQPDSVVNLIFRQWNKIFSFPSGSFVDIRNL